MSSGYSRWTLAGRKPALSFFSRTAAPRNLSLPPYHLCFLTTNSQTLYLRHLTHIQSCVLVGAAPENEVQAFDRAPDHGLRGCHFGFGSLSIPRLSMPFFSEPGRHTFFLLFIITFTHSSSCDHLILPSLSLSTRELAFMRARMPRIKRNSSKINSRINHGFDCVEMNRC